ncbi:MAG TPA: prolyl oligopeptidase family serine peptidase [Longimicrobiales bacterium]|nr:prolyl oligopeptidase family serine peptidase [Longimicrobiales bacterium]
MGFSIRSGVLSGLGFLLLAASVPAQQPTRSAAQGPARGSRLITPADIKAWNSIRQSALSNDGKWFAYVVAPNEGNATLVVRGTAQNAKETRIAVGENGGSIAISGDSKWLGYVVAPPRQLGRAAGRGGRGRGGPPADSTRADSTRAATPADSTPQRFNKFVLMNLATGESKEFERIRSFRFNAEQASWVAMQGYPAGSTGETGGTAQGGRGGRGGQPGAPAAESGGNVDLLLYHLTSGELFNMGLVREYAFNESGEWLAYTKEAPEQVGNAVQLRNLKNNLVKSLEAERVLYRQLAWVDSSRALSVMRGKLDQAKRDTVFSIVTFTQFGSSGPAKKLVFDPAGRDDFPKGWKLASDRAPRYATDMSAVFFGIREVPPAPPDSARRNVAVQPGAPGMGGNINIQQQQQGRAGGAGAADSTPSLILWHAKDPRLQSQQIVQEQNDRRFSYLAAYRFDAGKFIRLADDAMREVSILPKEKYAYGTDNREYQQQASYSGRDYSDVYQVDLNTGARTLLWKKRPVLGFGSQMLPAPDGRKLLYWGMDGHYWVLDLATRDSVNITKNVPTSFVNSEDDHYNIFPRPIAARGWSRDGTAVVLSDNWDLWKVPASGTGTAVNLTGNGKTDQIRYRQIYAFRNGRPDGNPGIDLSRPLYIGTYGEWTKREGLARVNPGKPGAQPLFFEDARFAITKARDADVYLYTRQTFTEYPNWWVFNPGFKFGYQITDVNPQMKEFAWSSGTRLIDYTNEKGAKLQGALYLPANYEEGKKYPLLVTIYEKRSQNKNGFASPSETRAPDPTLFTNRGYAVLDPDIVYYVNDPGMSAVWAVIPAVKAAIATGVVDEKNVGLWGHSWGGYQTSFLVTQTNIFKAAIAGAPLTDMVSMYSSVYWNTGGANQAIFESSQGRFKGNFIENYDAYIRNSPAFHANKVTTPLIILHNDKDGAVDFNQGITYFNTLRQLGKQVILLEYVGENHGLARPVNQRDYATRMSEWFDHHLKGAPAVDWIKDGVPRLKMDEHLRQRRDSTVVRPRVISNN